MRAKPRYGHRVSLQLLQLLHATFSELNEVSRLCPRSSVTRQHCPHSGTMAAVGQMIS
jgi:hypothetical protein